MSADKTRELVRRGQITRVHELSPDGIEWRKAEEFTEFYPKKAIVQTVAEVAAEPKGQHRQKVQSGTSISMDRIKVRWRSLLFGFGSTAVG